MNVLSYHRLDQVRYQVRYDEDLAHMLLECPAFIHQRKPIYSNIKNQVINCIGAPHGRELFNNRDSLVKLILDF